MQEKKLAHSKRVEQAEMVKTIGARMRAARELCNMSQSAAARRLGYANPSKLCKVEMATDTFSVPLLLIKNAASVYEVSIDYLFGGTDDWEIGARMTQERETSAWLNIAWEKSRRRDMDTLRKFHNQLQAFESVATLMFGATGEVRAALERFAELNPEYQDMKAGSRLEGSVERAHESAKHAKAQLKRFRMDCALAMSCPEQMHLQLQ